MIGWLTWSPTRPLLISPDIIFLKLLILSFIYIKKTFTMIGIYESTKELIPDILYFVNKSLLVWDPNLGE